MNEHDVNMKLRAGTVLLTETFEQFALPLTKQEMVFSLY
jgi:hypothetical protein